MRTDGGRSTCGPSPIRPFKRGVIVQFQGGKANSTGRTKWFEGKRPVFQFVGLFVVLLGAFYGFTYYFPLFNKRLLPQYMRLNARASALILSAMGEGASANGTAVSSRRYSVDIRHGCDAVAPSALFIAAVLAFPSSIRSKLPGLVAGTVILAVINLIRIVSLFYTGIFYPKAFEFVHVDIWQPVFVLFSLTLWVIWALWATRRMAPLPKET